MGGTLLTEQNEVIIRLKGISRNYSNGSTAVKALQAINLEIAEGEFLGIMGPSGSGKSSLLNIIGCLDAPTSGKYILNGKGVNAVSRREKAVIRNKVFGFIFQAFYLIPDLDVAANVALPLKYSKFSRSKWNSLVAEALRAVGLEGAGDRYPDQLSGGEQQRVAIARALVTDPKVILADEPTGNLDSAGGRSIMEVLLTLQEQKGKTILVASHDPRITGYAKRIIRLEDGLLSEDIHLHQDAEESWMKNPFAVPDEEE